MNKIKHILNMDDTFYSTHRKKVSFKFYKNHFIVTLNKNKRITTVGRFENVKTSDGYYSFKYNRLFDILIKFNITKYDFLNNVNNYYLKKLKTKIDEY